MPLYEVTNGGLLRRPVADFAALGFYEREGLQQPGKPPHQIVVEPLERRGRGGWCGGFSQPGHQHASTTSIYTSVSSD